MASEDWEELTVIQLLPINSTKALPDSADCTSSGQPPG